MPQNQREQRSSHLSGAEWLELLETGEIEVEGRLPWSSNFSFLAVVSSPGLRGRPEPVSARAVYKPGRGERPLWDFGPQLFLREAACYELSAALSLGIVPETVVRADGPLGPGSLQRFVEADFEQHYFTLLEDARFHGRLKELAAFDVLCNNADRKSGHVLLDEDGQIWAIDNGLSLHEDDKLRTVVWDFAGDVIPPPVLKGCRTLVTEGVPERLRSLIDDDECGALLRRARMMLRNGRLPRPREDHRSYPWPLV